MFNRLLRKNRFNFSRVKLIIIIAGLILILFIFGLVKERLNRRQIDRQISDLENQIKSAQRANNEISALIEEWQSGSQLEKEARLKLGLKKPGEKVVMIMRESSSTVGNAIINNNTEIIGNVIVSSGEDDVANPLKWWRYFFTKK